MSGRAIHERPLDMCSGIIAVQSGEIPEMQSWFSGWYGVSNSPGRATRKRADAQ